MAFRNYRSGRPNQQYFTLRRGFVRMSWFLPRDAQRSADYARSIAECCHIRPTRSGIASKRLNLP